MSKKTEMQYWDVYFVLDNVGEVESVRADSKTAARQIIKMWYPNARVLKALATDSTDEIA